ncbi:hypothetical protein GBA52_025282 [Prunus armeniaca]|nr:hypothetical protein GBA52_025282 [Prunus armeniaca]
MDIGFLVVIKKTNLSNRKEKQSSCLSSCGRGSSVQDPPEEEFSAADLTWTKFGTAEHHDDACPHSL